MAKIPIVYNEPVKIIQLPRRDIGELLSDCLKELAILSTGGSVTDQTHELIDAVNEYFELEEKRAGGCTCQETCSWNCKGECGCESCQDVWEDFLSVER